MTSHHMDRVGTGGFSKSFFSFFSFLFFPFLFFFFFFGVDTAAGWGGGGEGTDWYMGTYTTNEEFDEFV